MGAVFTVSSVKLSSVGKLQSSKWLKCLWHLRKCVRCNSLKIIQLKSLSRKYKISNEFETRGLVHSRKADVYITQYFHLLQCMDENKSCICNSRIKNNRNAKKILNLSAHATGGGECIKLELAHSLFPSSPCIRMSRLL